MQFDVVVVGAGTAGMACAIALAEAGVPRIALVEKDVEVGGALHISAGQLSGSASRLQRAQGIEDSPEAHLADINRLGHGKAVQPLAALAVREAGATIDWLEELGFPFPEGQPFIYYGHDPYTTPRTYWAAELGVAVLKTVQPRLEQLVAEGRIDLRFQHRLTDLIVEDGAVVGVQVDTPAGPAELRAPRVALTTGGYAASRALYDRFHPGLNVLLGARQTSQGEGLLAAERAGAGLRGFEHHLSTLGGIDTHPGTGWSDLWDAIGNTNANYRPPREIYVNARGERYIAEDIASQDVQERALMEQGGRVWLVFDEASIGGDDAEPLVTGWSAEMLREKGAAGENGCVRADTIDELARLAGIDPAGLAATVAAWNEACRAGSDPLGRADLAPVATAPFYALRSEGITVISWGGITVDEQLRVTTADGRAIPGLYAAGEIIGVGNLQGDAFCSGMAATPAMSLGRWLARELAAQVAAAAR